MEEIKEQVLTLEEQTELEIRKQEDSIDYVVRHTQDEFQSIIYSVLQSSSLGKKIVTYFDYIEELEDREIVGRTMQGVRKEVMDVNIPIEVYRPNILRQRG